MTRPVIEPNVDALWYGLQPVVAGLQAAGRLPATGQLYDVRLDLVKDHLRRGGTRRSLAGFGSSGVERALDEAGRISGRNHGASFLAYELIKHYCSAVADDALEAKAAQKAADELRKAGKELEKERKREERRRG
jgi:hypothetical protein